MVIEDIGRILEDGTIERGKTDQGMVFKSYNAFEAKTGTCYVPELSDYEYDYYEFLEEAKGDEKIAAILFDMVDWQSPCSLVQDMRFEEMELCDDCDKYYLVEGEENIPCPICGKISEQ